MWVVCSEPRPRTDTVSTINGPQSWSERRQSLTSPVKTTEFQRSATLATIPTELSWYNNLKLFLCLLKYHAMNILVASGFLAPWAHNLGIKQYWGQIHLSGDVKNRTFFSTSSVYSKSQNYHKESHGTLGFLLILQGQLGLLVHLGLVTRHKETAVMTHRMDGLLAEHV
jgi:hypothetical protein